MMWCDVVRCDVVWCDVVWCDMMWYDVVWCGVVWCGVVWYHMMWYDGTWCDEMWWDVMWCDLMRSDVMWCGVVSCYVTWCDMMWCLTCLLCLYRIWAGGKNGVRHVGPHARALHRPGQQSNQGHWSQRQRTPSILRWVTATHFSHCLSAYRKVLFVIQVTLTDQRSSTTLMWAKRRLVYLRLMIWLPLTRWVKLPSPL